MELLGIFTFAIPQAPHKVEKELSHHITDPYQVEVGLIMSPRSLKSNLD